MSLRTQRLVMAGMAVFLVGLGWAAIYDFDHGYEGFAIWMCVLVAVTAYNLMRLFLMYREDRREEKERKR